MENSLRIPKSSFGDPPKPTRQRRVLPDAQIRKLFGHLPQILKHSVFFVRARTIREKSS